MKKQLLIIFFAFISITTFAQTNKQYLLVNGGGGLNCLQYKLNNGDQTKGGGFDIGANYQYYFSSDWGITGGLGIQSAKSKSTLDFMSSKEATDADGDTYEYRTYFSGWKEKQNALFLEIPVAALYLYSIKRDFDLLVSAGIKIAIPLHSTYKVTSGTISTTGYYEQWNVELTDMPQHGFTTTTEKYNGDLPLKTTIALDVQIGGLYKLNNDLNLYFGAYLNYGLNNMKDKNSNPVYQGDGTYNGTLHSNLTDRVGLINLGIKVGLRWNLAKWLNNGNKTKFS